MQTSISDALDTESAAELTQWLRSRALREGFDAFGIAAPMSIRKSAPNLYAYLSAGFHGDMNWLARNPERRANPSTFWPSVRSIAVLAMNYAPATDPLSAAENRSHAAISAYAQGADYHDVIKPKLKVLGRDLAARCGADVKVFVDTAAVMEKPLAEAASLGWQGKHTNLVSTEFGSWLFLGAIYTTAELVADEGETDHCGSCRKCLDICPTNAFPAPYRIDARRCISYLTIEHKGQISLEFREPMGNRIYGCDDCLAVCPWNKFAKAAREARFSPRAGADSPPLADLLQLNEASFRQRFSGSPIKRVGRDRFIRNVLVATGNSGNPDLIGDVMRLLTDRSPLVRGMAVWAIRRLLPQSEKVMAVKAVHLANEIDDGVRAEWE